MLKILSREYPLKTNFKILFKISLSIGIFISLFLIIFKPFELFNLKINSQLIPLAIGYGFIAFFVSLSLSYLLPKTFPSYFKIIDWTIGKELFVYFIIILCISFVNFYYDRFIVNVLKIEGFECSSAEKTLNIFGKTIIVGSLPLGFLLFIHQNILLRKRIEDAAEMSEALNLSTKTEIPVSMKIEIVGTGKNEKVSFNNADFLFVVSKGNYCEVNYLKNSEHSKKLIRATLSSIEKQLDSLKQVIKVHRSYLVNLNKVDKIIGNARGYKLVLLGINEPIPVSKKKDDFIQDLI